MGSSGERVNLYEYINKNINSSATIGGNLNLVRISSSITDHLLCVFVQETGMRVTRIQPSWEELVKG